MNPIYIITIFCCLIIATYFSLSIISKNEWYIIRLFFMIRYSTNVNSKNRLQIITNRLSQSSFHIPSYIHLHQLTLGSDNYKNKTSFDEGYTVTLKTSNINDRIIQASIIESTHFRREEAYIVKYIDPIEQPVIDYDSNPCKSFSFPYCVLQNYDDSDHYSFSYSIFYQSGYVIYIVVDQLDVPLNYLNSTLIDSVLLSLHNNETDVFTCTTYSNRLLNGCLIARQSLIREILTKTTMSKGKLDVLDYVPLYFKEMNRELKVDSMMIRASLSPYLDVKDKLIPSVFGCNDLTENDTSFTVSVTTYCRPKMNMVFDAFDKQDLQPKQVIMIQNRDILNWNTSLFANRKTQYYHIWCSNWNSGYVGKYQPGIMVDTTFNFLIDDDMFIKNDNSFTSIINAIPLDNAIYGIGCAYFKKPTWEKTQFCLCDHNYWVLYPRVKHLKNMFQKALFTYSGGEDIELCVINFIECGIVSKRFSVSLTSSQGDEYGGYIQLYNKSHVLPHHNISYPTRSKEMKREGYFSIYLNYIHQGFIPSSSRNKSRSFF